MHSDLCMQFLFDFVFIFLNIFLSIGLFVFEPKFIVLGLKSLHTIQTHLHSQFKSTWDLKIKFLLAPIFDKWQNAFSFVLKILGCYKPSPLKQNLVPRFKKS